MPKQTYSTFLSKYTDQFNELSRKSRAISLTRLVVIIAIVVFIYLYFQMNSNIMLVLAILLSVGFVFLVRYYNQLVDQRKFVKALVEINENELEFLENGKLSFADGLEFTDPTHPYSYDLDFFGPRSLFQVLNRTETYVGQQTLATNLKTLKTKKAIIETQEAIIELSQGTEWRQQITAQAKVTDDSKEIYENLQQWTKTEIPVISKFFNIASYVMPVLFWGLMIYNFIFNAGLGDVCFYLFLLNIGLVVRNLKLIKSELIKSTKIDRTLSNYSAILSKFEKQKFNTPALNNLQNQLTNNQVLASEEIKKLSQLFGQLDNISNPFGMALVNGFFMYHLHVIRNFAKWKKQNAKNVIGWIKVMGEVEALISLSNFSYNNAQFVYPELNDDYVIDFKGLGHPLLSKSQRVTSNVSFEKENFIILTGSNMSGKSTFLRSLGVNMVLGGIGAPICAEKANIHPIPVYVSMRVSDSLNDNESFFFAEVKRLKEVMDAADKTVSFVLLDEILRGTNSDDKRTGTVEVVKKILSKNAIGALATHDLKVCDTTADYPDQLTNKCFEVEIIDNDLFFDYKLREGVCKNKSATFLMEKMGVI